MSNPPAIRAQMKILNSGSELREKFGRRYLFDRATGEWRTLSDSGVQLYRARLIIGARGAVIRKPQYGRSKDYGQKDVHSKSRWNEWKVEEEAYEVVQAMAKLQRSVDGLRGLMTILSNNIVSCNAIMKQ